MDLVYNNKFSFYKYDDIDHFKKNFFDTKYDGLDYFYKDLDQFDSLESRRPHRKEKNSNKK